MRQLTEDLFRVCCIPFFLYGISFGDVVRAPADELGTHVISEVAENSGHRTLRVTLRRTTNDEGQRYLIRASLANSVRALDGSIEFYSEVLMAIDAPTEQSYARLRDELRRREQALELEYEEGD